ncbi:hypothetical protein PENTCL1PPCAC_10531, partial [Pristionchus entomophagus]
VVYDNLTEVCEYNKNSRSPTGIVTDESKVEEILKLRRFCQDTETSMERLDMPFPFIACPIDTRTKENDNEDQSIRDHKRPLESSKIGNTHMHSIMALVRNSDNKFKENCDQHLREITVTKIRQEV